MRLAIARVRLSSPNSLDVILPDVAVTAAGGRDMNMKTSVRAKPSTPPKMAFSLDLPSDAPQTQPTRAKHPTINVDSVIGDSRPPVMTSPSRNDRIAIPVTAVRATFW